MASKSHHRKVLIFGDEPSIRNLLNILVEELERANTAVANRAGVLAAINRKAFDAVLLDLRCSKRASEDGVSGIAEIWPSLVGRVLAINAEVSDLKTLEQIERHLSLYASQPGLLHDMAGRLRMLLHIAPSPSREMTLDRQ
jgi:DNA-binding NtrC family response regulator